MSLVGQADAERVRPRQRTSPLVSVLIPVYNAGEYFRPSLQSILNQTHSNLDIIVVDDGSTDGCVDLASDLIAADSRVRLFRQANATKPVALNRALDQARGEFYATHDADDVSHPARIERQLAALLEKPQLAAVFCGHEVIIGGRAMAPSFASKSEADCRRAVDNFLMPAHDPTGMYRMALVAGMRYDATLPGLEGNDYILRVGEQHPMSVVGECLYQYRILNTSVTRADPFKRDRILTEALKRACERRGVDYESRFAQGPRWKSKNAFKDNHLRGNFVASVLDQKRSHMHLGAIKAGIECARLHPLDFDYYKPLVWALVPTSVIRRVRRDEYARP
jgi:glycosyltransferase involved in cell wall biosynthesis